MTSPNDTPLNELGLSFRTAGLLEELSIETVGQLLALPTISATRASVDELMEVLEELGLQYPGEWDVLGPTDLRQATGDVGERWQTIAQWLQEERPSWLEGFGAPASPEAIEAAEAELGGRLPADYRAFLRLHNGQSIDEPMVWTCWLRPVEELAELTRELSAAIDDEEQPVDGDVDPAVRAVNYSPGWIPIGVSARGRDFLCLDLDPTEQGDSGQVILIAVDSDDHQLLARSFADFLSVYFTEAQRGELDVDE